MSDPLPEQRAEWPTTPWHRALRRIGVDLRPQETPQVMVLFGYSFLLGIFQFSSKAVRQATYVDALGAEKLPWVFLCVALAAYPTLRLYGNLAQRWSSSRVIALTAVAAAAIQVLFWWLLGQRTWIVAFLFFVWIAVAIALTLTQLWSYVNSVLDTRQARRLFAFIGGGGLLGGVLGGQVASWAGMWQPRAALLAGAAVLAGIAVLVTWSESAGWARSLVMARERTNSRHRVGEEAPREAGLASILRSPHLRLLALITVVTVVVAEVIDLQFNWMVERSAQGWGERTQLFGNLFSAMGLSAFLFQIIFTSRIHRLFGVGSAMRVLPIFVLIVSLFAGAADLLALGGLTLAVYFLRIGDHSLRYSLDHATRELLFVPLGAGERVVAKSYIDVLVHRAAKGLGAVLLLTVTVGWVTVMQATAYTLVLGVFWLLLTVKAQQNYVDSLRDGLVDSAIGGQDDSATRLDLNDVTTLEVLIESLGSADSNRVLSSIDLLAANRRARLVPPLLLHHDDPQIRRRTLEVLTQAGRRDALGLIEVRLGDPEQEVRVAAIQALAALSGTYGPDLMAERLEDPDPRVRAAAVGCLAAQQDEELRSRAEKTLLGMLSDAGAATRAEAAKSLSVVPEPVFQQHLVTLLYDSDHRVVAAAIAAVRERISRHGSNPLFVPILISLLRDRRLKHEAREALVSCGEPVLPVLAHFLNDRNEHIWVRRALPKTIARLGTSAAAATLYESLDDCSDPFLRRKVIEALARCHDPADEIRIRRFLVGECRRYMRSLFRLVDVTEAEDFLLRGPLLVWREGYRPTLLQQLLDERRRDHLDNICGLLSLGREHLDILRAWNGLVDEDRQQRSQAIEYLDNVLSGETRRAVLTVVDDLPLGERLSSGQRHFGLRSQSKVEVLRQLIEVIPDGDEVAPWLAAAAVQTVCVQKVQGLYGALSRWSRRSQNGLVRETAEWACQRVIT